MAIQGTDWLLVERSGALHKARVSDLPSPSEAAKETDPEFTYVGAQLTRIDYASTNYKLFTYTNGLLTRVDYHKGSQVLRKDLVYVDGRLSQIIDTVV